MRKYFRPLPGAFAQTMPRILDLLAKSLLAFLPFSVLFAVFFGHKLGIPGMNYVKEILLAGFCAAVAFAYWKNRVRPRFEALDYAIFGYFGWMLFASLVNRVPLAGFVFGGRYDFEFLVAFLAFRHGFRFLPGKISEYLRPFLVSASAAVVLGLLIRFVLHEEILIHFGYSPNLSNWKFGGSVPIYHGIDGANVRRFQGIFDGPNPAAFFLIAYLGVLFHYFRNRKDAAYLVSLWGLVVLGLILYTYSRSALVGIVLGVSTLVAFSLKDIWTKHRKSLFVAVPVILLLAGAFYVKFESSMDRIVLREGSSKGHFSRMVTGIERFREHPVFGEGLAASGPAYRYVVPQNPDENLYEGETKAKEDYYIPESWYVQQLVEGGLPAIGLFSAIVVLVALAVFPASPAFFAAFVACAAMNLFLHSYESAYASVSLFAIAGMFSSVGKNRHARPSGDSAPASVTLP